MTDVGKISLGVELDADDLASRLGEAVRRAIAPALAKVQAELNKVQREYDQTARASEKANTAQAAGAKAVAEAVEQIGNEQTKTAAKTSAAGAVTTRQLNAITRAYERQTAAIIKNTAARAANAATPVGAAPATGGFGGGGGGAPPRRTATGDLFTGQGGGGRFITSPVGVNAIALGIGSLPAASAALIQVVGGVQQLAQAGLALPGIYGGVAASIGTAVLGFKGLGEATEALSEAMKTGDPKDLEKAKEVMQDLHPATVAVAETLAKLNRGPLLEFRKNIAGQMLDGFDQSLQGLADKALPRVESGMGKVATAWNGTLKTLTTAAGRDSNLNLMDRIFGNTAEGQTRANAAIEPLVHALGTLTAAGTDVLPRLGDGLTDVAHRFDAWITRVDGDGRLAKWIDQGLTGLRQLGETGLNLIKIVTNLTQAAGADQGGFLTWLESATSKLRDLTGSASGQASIARFFREGREQAAQWLPILQNFAELLGDVYEASKTWTSVLLPVLRGITEALTAIPGLTQAVLVGFLAWKSITLITTLTSGLSRMSGVLDALPGKAQRAGRGLGAIGGALGSTRGTTGLGLLAAGSITSLTSDQGDVAGQLMGALSTVGGGALTGAAIGSVIPGLGTGIGALIGGGVGTALAGINYLLADNKAATDAAAAAAEAHAAALDRSRTAMELTNQATKSANDSLLASGGAFDAASLGAVGDMISQIPDRLAGAYDESTLKGIASALGDVNMTTEQLSQTVTGAGPQFDALTARLTAMGPNGAIAATQLQNIRDQVLGTAANAQTAAPLLQGLADRLGVDIPTAAVNVQNALAAVPKDVPINLSAPGGEAVFQLLTDIGVKVTTDNAKNILVEAPLAPAVLEQLRALGYEVTQNNDKTINVSVNQAQYEDTFRKLGTLGDMYRQLLGPGLGLPNVPAPAPQPQTVTDLLLPPPRPGGADGMVIPGYAPGHDVVNAVLAPGEGVLIPEAVRGLGGAAAVYAINSRFRSGLSKRYYADGGVEPHLGTGALPGPPPVIGPDTELSVLIQIRDLLSGKGGAASNPLAATAANTATVASAADASGTTMGPFGTPLKKRGNPGYEMAAAALQALGADPEKWIGADPSTYVPPGVGQLPGVTGAGLPVNYAAQAAALAAFARSGDLADVAGLGLNANDPVITALTSARNKKKGGLDDDQIAGLVDQVLGQGGYGGVLDETNTSLIKSLTRYREQLMKQQGLDPNAVGTTSSTPTSVATAMPTSGTGAQAVIDLAMRSSGGQYKWGGSDLAKGLSDCSGAVSDLVELITKGQADPGRLFATSNARDVLTKLGAVEGAIPGALQIGWSDTHMRSTLPNGVAFESGGGTGQGATYGGNAKGAEGMPNIMSLPVGALPPGYGLGGMTGASGGVNALGYSGGGPVPVYIVAGPNGGLPPGMDQILGAGLGAAGGAAGDVASDIVGAVGGLGQEAWRKRAPAAGLDQLLDERNPLALAEAMGFDVQDFTRAGGAFDQDQVQKSDQQYDASGRLFSDTAGLMDRTFSSLQAQLSAMREQLVDVIEQTNQRLAESALEPVIKAGMQSALEGLKDSVSTAIGSALGNAAAPPIADAVSSAVSSLPIDQSGAGNVGNGLAGVVAQGFAGGGPVSGGTPGKDSVPALLMPGEYVLNTAQVARMGGFAAVDTIASRGMRRYATGGGVIGNDSVGAEFFGVSEVPILGAIVNLIIRTLLQVIGVEIESRDTLNEMTDEFRGFRGDAFKAFDAQGRLLNDTSGLIERTQSSTETAAEERIRILKIVIQAIIKYIIEKVIVPITKAVANAAIQAGASAAGAAVNTQAPGAGGIVSSLISSAGQAGVEIAAEVGTDFALAMSEQLINVVAEGLQSAAPDLVNNVFGGGLLAGLFDPAGGFLTTLVGGLFGAFAGLFGGLFGGASTLIPGIPFDQGGMATGKGLMLKDVDDDELVLKPVETDLFTRFVKALENGGFGGGRTNHVSAPITVIGGGRETAEQVSDRLVRLMS
ncbi:tape measure protein [Mycobacterium phage KayaCho]|uniref:tail length tape measure protein n=1 Tax=Mycobacterium phage KayaCho TaxID=1340830 RepID=UPI0003880720|nr:tail length tape measure protein [Mycobacterium phage KayaCho]AGT12927.1 tape measure protein [Mycobacterium phage KayaCho]